MTYSDHDLKEYLTSDFKDATPSGLCLVEIYLRDPKYFSELVKNRIISAKAATFCAVYDKQLQDLRYVTDEAFFRSKLSFLIDDFLNKTDQVDHITWEAFDQYKKDHAPKKESGIITNQDNNFPASEKGSDSIPAGISHFEKIQKGEKNRKVTIKAKSRDFNSAKNKEASTKAALFAKNQAFERANKNVYNCPYDDHLMVPLSMITGKDPSGNITYYPIFYCRECGRRYVSIETERSGKDFCSKRGIWYLNIHPTGKKQEKQSIHPSSTSNTISEAQKNLTDHDKLHKLKCFCYENDLPNHCWNHGCHNHSIKTNSATIHISGKPYLVYKCKDCGVIYIKKGLYELYPERFDRLEHDEKQTQIHEIEDKPKEVNIRTQEVMTVDIIVKGNTFQCVHRGHAIESIRAQVPIILKNGWIISTTVPAGYCKSCGTYFIRESTFKHLKNLGVVACRVTTESSYYQGERDVPYSDMAPESILMEHGYNVSATSNLSGEARQKILSLMIDNKIISKSRIIDYLQYFISQRINQKKDYSAAIEKWEDDISFVQSYKEQNARTVKAGSIKYRKH